MLYFMPFYYFAVLGLLLSFFLGVAVRAILLLLLLFLHPIEAAYKIYF